MNRADLRDFRRATAGGTARDEGVSEADGMEIDAPDPGIAEAITTTGKFFT